MTTILKIKALDIDIRKLKKELCIYINPISIYKKSCQVIGWFYLILITLIFRRHLLL